MRHYCIYLILLLLVSLFSCTGKEHKQSVTVSNKDMKSSMETANRYLLNEEEEDIMNQKVSLEYELHSVSGDLIYSSENDGVKTFIVGDGSVESGLDEAMGYLHYGDVAKLIIPFHLGYGLHGDDNRIPEYATLVYTIKVIANQ